MAEYGFQTALETRILDGGRVELLSDLIYKSPENRQWRVPAGFICNLASVPKIVPGFIRIWFGDKLETAKSATLHDWFYSRGVLSRADADHFFWEALVFENGSRLGAWIMWAGVRCGGFLAWRASRKLDK